MEYQVTVAVSVDAGPLETQATAAVDHSSPTVTMVAGDADSQETQPIADVVVGTLENQQAASEDAGSRPVSCHRDNLDILNSSPEGWSETVDAFVTHSSTKNIVASYLQMGGCRLVLYHKLILVRTRYQNIKSKFRGKKQAAELNKFLIQEFQLPLKKITEPLTPQKQKLKTELKNVKTDLKRVKRALEEKDDVLTDMRLQLENLESFTKAAEEATRQSKDQEYKLKCMEQQYTLLSRQLQTTTERLNDATTKIASYTPRNTNKRLKRKDAKLESQNMNSRRKLNS